LKVWGPLKKKEGDRAWVPRRRQVLLLTEGRAAGLKEAKKTPLRPAGQPSGLLGKKEEDCLRGTSSDF